MTETHKNNHFVPLVMLNHWRRRIPWGKGDALVVWRYDVAKKLKKHRWTSTPVAFPFASASDLYVVGHNGRRDISLELLFSTYEDGLSQLIQVVSDAIAAIESGAQLPSNPVGIPKGEEGLKALISLRSRSRFAVEKMLEALAQDPALGNGAADAQTAVVDQLRRGVDLAYRTLAWPRFIVLHTTRDNGFCISDIPSVSTPAPMESVGIPAGSDLIVLTDRIAILYFSSTEEDAWSLQFVAAERDLVECVNLIIAEAAREWLVAPDEATRDRFAAVIDARAPSATLHSLSVVRVHEFEVHNALLGAFPITVRVEENGDVLVEVFNPRKLPSEVVVRLIESGIVSGLDTLGLKAPRQVHIRTPR